MVGVRVRRTGPIRGARRSYRPGSVRIWVPVVRVASGALGDGWPAGQGESVNRYADIDSLIRATDEAFQATLHAVLDGDRHAGRLVLHGSSQRRDLLAAARCALRARAWVPSPQLGQELRYVAEIGHLGGVVDRLARHVVAGGDPVRLTPSRRMEVAVLLDAGERRFRQLAEGAVAGGLDPSYRGCAATLFEVADRASRDRSISMALCGALAAGLLQASRCAAAAA